MSEDESTPRVSLAPVYPVQVEFLGPGGTVLDTVTLDTATGDPIAVPVDAETAARVMCVRITVLPALPYTQEQREESDRQRTESTRALALSQIERGVDIDGSPMRRRPLGSGATPDHASPGAAAAYVDASLEGFVPEHPNRQLARVQFQLGLDASGRLDPSVPRCGARNPAGGAICNMRRHHTGDVHRTYIRCNTQHQVSSEWQAPRPAFPAVEPFTIPQEHLTSGPYNPLGIPGM